MRQRPIVPSWLVPSVFCVAALILAAYVKVKFDYALDEAAAASTVPTTSSTAALAAALSPPGPSAPRGQVGSDDVEGNGTDGLLHSEVAPGYGPSGTAGGPVATLPPADPIATVPALDASGTGAAGPDASQPDALAAGAGPDGVGASGDGADNVRADLASGRPVSWVDPASSGRPWSALGAQEGLLTFRGNPTRSFYGQGPVPRHPSVVWSVPIGCSQSAVGATNHEWCGSGWTGQPTVFRGPSTNQWWLAFGGYNKAVNFLDPASGATVYPPYYTGDIIKGTVTIDPDGYPLLYTGSRDDHYHVVALDRPQPTALWKLWAYSVQPTLWNNDWDGSGLVIGDYLFEGGENSRFYVVKLNRGYGSDGLVTVNPQVVFTTEAWDAQLLSALGDLDVSVENSVAISGNTVYFANSGGLVQGWDIGGLASGRAPTRVFRFWTGDDTDASVVIDGQGMLYVGSEYERGNQRAQDVGQIMKLDPSKPDDPLVWSRPARAGLESGVWATPALYHDPRLGDTVLVATNEGRELALDAATGVERWEIPMAGPLWSSPVVVDGTLIQGDCAGNLNAYDLTAAPATGGPPPKLWSVYLGGCVESTPAVWDGRIFVGTRMGFFYAVGD